MSAIIDLRSDTVTRPTAAMRQAMAQAEVGDDVFGEDPTVNKLQTKVAELLGKPASLFTPTGVMANQLALKCHTQPGDEVIVEEASHIFNYETAAPSILSNVQLHTIKGTRGILRVEQLGPAVRSNAYYMQRTSLICLENTHNSGGGTIYPLDEIKSISAFAKTRGISLHLDGARLWNVWAATGIHPKEYAQYFDSVAVCFSKGLGAPVGSALAGSIELIQKARKFRKVFGGGMRQAGIIAAGALFALENHIDLLKEDHNKAQFFARAIAAIPNFVIDLESVQTNIVISDISKTGKTADEIIAILKNKGVLLTDVGRTKIRAVMHMDVSMEQVETAANIIKEVFKA
ncbi:MAG: aminotransferase class I/II-fold pyridoxal phosphate-dependent enzyme [Ignavibacteriales bacterium]|nr:aminotransferase class I/II-fold pyridoxal phosphate-dependent enzyme [Ignavibacteriales bacterium]